MEFGATNKTSVCVWGGQNKKYRTKKEKISVMHS